MANKDKVNDLNNRLPKPSSRPIKKLKNVKRDSNNTDDNFITNTRQNLFQFIGVKLATNPHDDVIK